MYTHTYGTSVWVYFNMLRISVWDAGPVWHKLTIIRAFTTCPIHTVVALNTVHVTHVTIYVGTRGWQLHINTIMTVLWLLCSSTELLHYLIISCGGVSVVTKALTRMLIGLRLLHSVLVKLQCFYYILSLWYVMSVNLLSCLKCMVTGRVMSTIVLCHTFWLRYVTWLFPSRGNPAVT